MIKIWKTEIKTITKTKDIGYMSRKLKMKYAGQNRIRNQEDRWNRGLWYGEHMVKKRRTGEPKTRREEEIIKFCGIAWGGDARFGYL